MKKILNNVLTIATLCLLFCLCTFDNCGAEALSLTAGQKKSSSPIQKNPWVIGVLILGAILVFVVPIAVSVSSGGDSETVTSGVTSGGDVVSDQETAFLSGYENGWELGHDDEYVFEYSADLNNAEVAYDVHGDGADELMWKAGWMEAKDRAHYEYDGSWNPNDEYDDSMYNNKYDGVEGRVYAVDRWNFW